MKSLVIVAFLSLAIAQDVHQEGEQCGGFAGFLCASGLECKYGPNQWQPPHADAAGTCVDPTKELCGGFAAFKCPDRWFCVLDGDFPDAGGHCEQCPLRKCAVIFCPFNSTSQPTSDDNGCPGCPCCKRPGSDECVGTDQPQACGRGLPQCPDGYYCDVSPNDAGSVCRLNQRFCTLDAKICDDGTSVGRNADDNCNFFPCPKRCNPNRSSGCSTGQKCSPRCKKRNGRKISSCVPTTWLPLAKLPQCPH